MKLYLVRHGETDENKSGIVLGWQDVKLNRIGIEQADADAMKFSHKIDAIFCSDLRRCLETAHPFREKFNDLPFLIDWRIRERCLGDAQGKMREDVFVEGSSELKAIGVETLDQHRTRVSSFIDSLKKLDYLYSSALVITHNGTINRFREILSDGRDIYHTYTNGEIVKLDI